MKKILRMILWGLLILGISYLFYFNFRYNNKFFVVPFYMIINIFIAIFIAYYLTQFRNDQRKRKELVENMLSNIQVILSCEKMSNICDETDLNYIRINQRSIMNKLSLSEEFVDEFSIKDEISYVKQQFEQYWDLVSNHINDYEHLKNSNKDLSNYITKIQDKLEFTIVKLYKK